VGQGVLRANIIAAAAFEDQPHAGFGRGVLIKVEGGRAGADVGAVVFAGDGVHRILAQIPLLGGPFHRGAGGARKVKLVEAPGAIHIKQDAAGVLADGLRFVFGQRYISLDDLHCAGGDRALLFARQRCQEGLVDIVGDFSRGAADQFQQRVFQRVHRPQAKPPRKPSQ